MPDSKYRKDVLIFLVFLLVVAAMLYGMPRMGIQRPRTEEEARTYLKHFHFACQNYWEEKGADRYCDIRIARKDSVYGFTNYEDIVFDGGGTHKDFSALVLHTGSGRIFRIDRKGEITEEGLGTDPAEPG